MRVSPFTIEHFARWVTQLELEDGDAFELEPFQRAFAEDLFEGVPEAWLIVPEGNGKSTFVSALALYHIRHREQAYVPIAASAQEQSLILFRQAEGFVRRSDDLSSEFQCRPGVRELRCAATGGLIKAKAADERTGDGVIPTCAILDELHRHRDLGLYRVWAGKLTKRPNSQIVVISTAGEPGSPFEEVREKMRQHAAAERSGAFTRVRTERFVLHDYSVSEGADVGSIEDVKGANPFSRLTVDVLDEKRRSPAMTPQHWSRFVCNRATRAEHAAIPEAEWFAAAGAVIPSGEPIALGLDVGWRWDTTAAVPLLMVADDDRRLGPATILVPPRDGTSLELHAVQDALVTVHHRNPIHTVVMDISDARDIAEWIETELGATVVERGTSLPAQAVDHSNFMAALRNGWLKHSGDPGLTAHAMNAISRILPGGDAVFSRPAQNRRSRQQDRRVIDALVAAAAVHTVVSSTPQASVYDERPLIVLDAGQPRPVRLIDGELVG